MSSVNVPKTVAKRFGYIVKRAQQTLRNRMDQVLKTHDLTTPQYAVMSAVNESPGLSNADLAKAAFVTPQTMQGIIATLEKRELLERSPDPKHGRRLIAQLTETGQIKLDAADAAVIEIEGSMLTSISASDIEQATATLLSYIRNVEREQD